MVLLAALLTPLSVRAVSLDEMMKATTRQQQGVFAKPQSAAPAPSPRPAAPAAATPPQSPATAAASAPSAALPSVSQKLPVGAGTCGLLGVQLGGCPTGGIPSLPPVPELSTLLASLAPLMNTAAGSNEQRLQLVRLANRLSKIDPKMLQSQLEALQKAPPSVQFGALRKIKLPEESSAQQDPMGTLTALITEAGNGGARIESGMQQAVAMLKAMRSRSTDPSYTVPLEEKIANLEVIAKSRLASAAAKQIIRPFYAENGMPYTHPLSNKPLTTQQIATTLLMMSMADEGTEGDEETLYRAASTSHERETSLDNL